MNSRSVVILGFIIAFPPRLFIVGGRFSAARRDNARAGIARRPPALLLDLRGIVGPEPEGPVAAEITDGKILLTNRIGQPVRVASIEAEQADGSLSSIPVDRRIESGQQLDLPAGAARAAHVDARSEGGTSLEEIRSFIEDIRTNVVFVNLVNFDNHELTAIEIEVRLPPRQEILNAILVEDDPVDEVELVLPLTSFFTDRTLELRLIAVRATDRQEGEWVTWSLDHKGSVVSVTPEMLPAKP